jgi:hypothetical protein
MPRKLGLGVRARASHRQRENCPSRFVVMKSQRVIYGTAAGGFTFASVRPIVKLVTSWNDTTPKHIAGASFWRAKVRRPAGLPFKGPTRSPVSGPELCSGVFGQRSVPVSLKLARSVSLDETAFTGRA